MTTLPIEAMREDALAARSHAYAPYSKFPVGACILTTQGKRYSGCNVENAAYPLSQCAEASAIGNMILNNAKYILAVLVIADTPSPLFPCGGCLQKISEFADKETQIICCNVEGETKICRLNDIFPRPFCRQDFIP